MSATPERAVETTDPIRDVNRRDFLRSGVAGAVLVGPLRALEPSDSSREPRTVQGAVAGARSVPEFELDEVTVGQLQQKLASGEYTSRRLTELYLSRIQEIDRPGAVALNAIIELNPEAVATADAMDAERRAKGPRGPLHGIPVLIKDNIDTADRMRTSAGSLALADSIAPLDAGVTRRLREAGAVIIGKTNLSEWANFRSSHSSSGWSGRGGQTRNPYALDRNPCGSSSGTGARAVDPVRRQRAPLRRSAAGNAHESSRPPSEISTSWFRLLKAAGVLSAPRRSGFVYLAAELATGEARRCS